MVLITNSYDTDDYCTNSETVQKLTSFDFRSSHSNSNHSVVSCKKENIPTDGKLEKLK